jgi:hypothetical protein
MVFKRKKGVNPAVAGVAGAVVGGAAVAATTVLRDKKIREELKDTAEQVKDQAMGYLNSSPKQAKKSRKK